MRGAKVGVALFLLGMGVGAVFFRLPARGPQVVMPDAGALAARDQGQSNNTQAVAVGVAPASAAFRRNGNASSNFVISRGSRMS